MSTETTAESQAKLKIIATLLGLEIRELHDNSVVLKVNEFQDLWVKLYGYRGKGHSQLSPAKQHRMGSNSPYWDNEKAYLSISFAEGKAPEAIAKDVSRRLLNSQFQADSLEYIREKVKYFNKGKDDEVKLKKDLTALGFDCRDTTAYYNSDGVYMTVRFENGSLYVDRFSPSQDKGLKVLAAIIKASAGGKK